MARPSRDWLAAAALAVVTAAVFARALNADFVNYDDETYVTNNRNVTSGLSAANTRWAFATYRAANWHPLTWLSLQLDASLWRTSDGKPDPRGFHLTNVLLHAANAALAFLALRSLTGAFWRSLAAALLFAVHPLRVESVAWVAERKDVLSVFFGLLALWAYAAYVRSPSARRYLPVCGAFALSLLAKPTLVTLPFLLLVLDWWPLARGPRGAWPLVREKVPLFALTAAACAITVVAQADQGAVGNLQYFPLVARLANAVVSYAMYLGQTFWPVGLTPYYPHLGSGLPGWQVGGAAALLAGLTAGALALRRRAPYLLAGWLWFLGTLVPVIGLVQVGGQAYADRYTYFPQLGLLVAVCWGVAALAHGRAARLALATGMAAAVALTVATQRQLAAWQDGVSLWDHALRVRPESTVYLKNLGEAFEERGELDRAADCYRHALAIEPDSGPLHADLGRLLSRQGKPKEAVRELETACRCAPDYARARSLLGHALFEQGDIEAAAGHYEAALRLAPFLSEAHADVAMVEAKRGNLDRAVALYREALALGPGDSRLHDALGNVLLDLRRVDEAVSHLRAAVRCDKESATAHNDLGKALGMRREFGAAEAEFREATRLDPNLATAWYNLGAARLKQGRPEAAAENLARAVELDPANAGYRQLLASVLSALRAAGREDLPRAIEQRLSPPPG